MDLKIKGKKALVSGSTAGIGWAIADLLAAEGVHVWVNGRTQERVDAAVERVTQHRVGAKVQGIAADLGTAAGCAKATSAVPEVDILINNLGIFEPMEFEKISDETWLKFFEVNVLSGVRLSRFYFPKMLKTNWGRIVFISSESAVNIPPEMIHYGMTKTAQAAVARGLAELTAGTNVTVNTVLAGPTRSEGVEEFLNNLATAKKTDMKNLEEEFFTSVRPSPLLRRFARPEEVAAMVVYVCGEPASATNGAALRADGGVVRSVL
ncbi:MAG TPA: SDR family oxidoreductase [Phycisphaerae bacterium]|nr:SDR family oxidoreductase [Phycisphaerae bacterium]